MKRIVLTLFVLIPAALNLYGQTYTLYAGLNLSLINNDWFYSNNIHDYYEPDKSGVGYTTSLLVTDMFNGKYQPALGIRFQQVNIRRNTFIALSGNEYRYINNKAKLIGLVAYPLNQKLFNMLTVQLGVGGHALTRVDHKRDWHFLYEVSAGLEYEFKAGNSLTIVPSYTFTYPMGEYFIRTFRPNVSYHAFTIGLRSGKSTANPSGVKTFGFGQANPGWEINAGLNSAVFGVRPDKYIMYQMVFNKGQSYFAEIGITGNALPFRLKAGLNNLKGSFAMHLPNEGKKFIADIDQTDLYLAFDPLILNFKRIVHADFGIGSAFKLIDNTEAIRFTTRETKIDGGNEVVISVRAGFSVDIIASPSLIIVPRYTVSYGLTPAFDNTIYDVYSTIHQLGVGVRW